MELMLITNSPEYAKYAEDCGVDIIFLDLEIDGKLDRQGHLDTVISCHLLSDIHPVKMVLSKAKLLVRINPYNVNKTKFEIDEAIKSGADMIMLPMFKTADEILAVHKIIDGRALFVPLLETIDAVESLDEILSSNVLTDLHIGLNDLHLDYGLSHMFELFSNKTVDLIVNKMVNNRVNYGIGGVAAMKVGDVKGELVLNKYKTLKSNRVILSRSFHDAYSRNLEEEVKELRALEINYDPKNNKLYNQQFENSINNLFSKRSTES